MFSICKALFNPMMGQIAEIPTVQGPTYTIQIQIFFIFQKAEKQYFVLFRHYSKLRKLRTR